MLLPALALFLIPVKAQTAVGAVSRNSTANPAHPTLAELREASHAFFSRMRDAGYGAAEAVVFGAASIKNHFPDFRSTPDLDLVIFEPNDLRLDTILETMVAGSEGKLSWENDKELLYYHTDQGRRVHLDAGYVDFGELYGVEMTASAAAADAVTSIHAVPYATPEEMFIIKICAARSRSALAKSLQDIDDAEFIAERVPVLQLVGDPPQNAVDCLEAFLPRSKYTMDWWLKKLGVHQLRPGYCTLDGELFQQAHRGLHRTKDMCWGNAALLMDRL